MAETTNISSINPEFIEFQDYSTQDDNLIVNFKVESSFDPLSNYISYFIYDISGDILNSQEENFGGFSIVDNNVVLDPPQDLKNEGYNTGNYNVTYNFLKNELNSSLFKRLYIDEISPDRTEIRLNTTTIPNIDLIEGTTQLKTRINENPAVYYDFYINFGENQLVIANNILLDTTNPNDPTVLIKLYEPLPIQFTLKDECWVVTQVADPIAYNISIDTTFEIEDEFIQLSGPNFNLGINDQINNSTGYTDYTTLTTSSYATGSGSLKFQINSLLAERGVEINVDYTDYTNFVYFSSALTRLENFYYKMQLIEQYTYSGSLSSGSNNSSYVTGSKDIWQSKIDEIITTFDGYDYYLYYESGSKAWPKTNSTYPYINSPTNSASSQAFITTQSISASLYDSENNNILIESVPSYLREDSQNADYELFVEMLGQMFDNIWIYYQDVTEKWNADNRINYGVSKDLVADILRDLGIKIYQNNFSSDDLYTAFLGVTAGGNQFPFPFITSSLPTPSGYEYINTRVSASSEVVPLDDVNKSIYKRIFHNLPLLLKKKGTTVGIQDLITAYGVPNTILRVSEFGGKDKDNTNDWDYWYKKYNYKLDVTSTPAVTTDWPVNSSWVSPNDVPATLQFRFKFPKSGSTNAVNFAVTTPSRSLWSLEDGSTTAIVIEYTGSGFSSGSYSGSIPSSSYEYANLKFTGENMTSSAGVYLPFFNGDWWSVMVTRNSDVFTLYASNNIYNGDDGSTIGFIASSSVTSATSETNWVNGTTSYFGSQNDTITLGGKTYQKFSGSYQEIRYYNTVLNSEVFQDYTMNPNSIEGIGVNSAPNQLIFRAALGGELYTGSVSIHPKVTGSWVNTSSFVANSEFIADGTFSSNTDTIYFDQPAVGIKNTISNKIQVSTPILPSGDTLSRYRSIQQQLPISASYTKNLAYTEVAFSPQNEINDDIMESMGFFNMGEYIGDPRQRFNTQTTYPNLDTLRNAYFEKYKNNYDINDYIRLIKYFDNSLFKMVADFTPARSSLAAGVVIKQHILERNKYPTPQVNTYSTASYYGSGSTNPPTWNTPITFQDLTITASIGSTRGMLNGQPIYTASSDYQSIPLETFTGSQGGTFITLAVSASGVASRPVTSSTGQIYFAEYGDPIDGVFNVTQSWVGFHTSPSGSIAFTQSNAQEFFNGELSGSHLIVENGELNEANTFKYPNTTQIEYDIYGYTLNDDGGATSIGENQFLALTPSNGQLFIYNYYGGPLAPTPTYGNKWILISKQDVNSVITTTSIQEITNINFPTAVFGSKSFTVLSISEKATYFVLLLAPDNINQSVANQGDLIGSFVTILEPYNSYTFFNSDDNVLFNNAQDARLASHLYDLDYSNGVIVPTNYLSVISASQQGNEFVVNANVQSYNWNVSRSILPRYVGSRLTATNYNTWSLGDQSYGKDPVINYYGNIAFDLDFVGGTYPELQNGTAINVIRANIFTSPNQSTVIDQSNTPVFNFVINQYLGYSQSAQIYSNDVSPIQDNNIRTLDGSIGWPANSIKFIPRQQSFGEGFGGVFFTGSLGGIIFCDKNYSLFPQIVDQNNRYATSSVPTPKGSYSVISSSLVISKSISSGENWYITLYSGSSYPLSTYDEAYISGGLDPYNSGSVYDYSNQFSLSSQGVYKITSFNPIGSPSGISVNSPYLMTTTPTLPDNVKGIGSGSKSDNNTGLSMLIWKSNPFPQPVIPVNRPDYFPSGIGSKGGYVIPDDFDNNLKGSLFALQTQGVANPVVVSNGVATQTVNVLPFSGSNNTPRNNRRFR